MNTEPSILEQLQLDVAARLQCSPGFRNIHVVAERPRDAEEATMMQTTIDNALAGIVETNGKAGATVQVKMPFAQTLDPNIPGPELFVSVVIRVTEAPLFNMGPGGTNLSAEQIALNVLQSLHHFDTGLSGSPLMAASRAAGGGLPMEPNLDEIENGKLIYDCMVGMRWGVTPVQKAPRVQFVKMDDPEGYIWMEVDVSGWPEGGAIYYTLDGSYPSPSNPTALLFNKELVPVTTSTLIRAAAYLDGFHGSDVTQTTIQ